MENDLDTIKPLPLGFSLASDLPKITIHDDQAELQRRMTEMELAIESLKEQLERPGVASPNVASGLKPEERQAFIDVISNLDHRITILKQDYDKKISELSVLITDHIPRLISNAERRLAKLESDRSLDSFDDMRDQLFVHLKQQVTKGGQDGIYLSALYNKRSKGRNVKGLFDIAQPTASRLKEACIADKRFKIERRGKRCLIKLNRTIM
jgi:hypothetical protein